MTKLSSLSDRALDLASAVGDNMKFMVPNAGTLLSTGAKLGAIRTGAKVAGLFLRRHPAITIATAAAGGLLWYAAYRRSRDAELGNDSGGNRRRTARIRQVLAGTSTRVDARNGDAQGGGGKSASTGKNVSTRRKASSTAGGKRAGGRASTRRGDESPAATTH